MLCDIIAFHDNLDPSDQAICLRLSALIGEHLPDAENKSWHAHPVWFIQGNPVVGYNKLKDCIRLLFWSGQSFREAGLTASGSFKAAEKRTTSTDQIGTLTCNAG